MNLCKISDCTGCCSCMNICPRNCINMQLSDNGFYYPKVNAELCIDCKLCESVCPQLDNDFSNYNTKPAVFLGGAYLSKQEIYYSSSGGIAYSLAKAVIEDNGIAFCATYNETWDVVFREISDIDSLHIMQGSKYVQSFVGPIYKDVKIALDLGKKVLFIGLGCQVAGLKAFLHKKQYPNLITCDLLCGGAPSPLVFKKYVSYLEKKYRCKIVDINFRDKKYGYGYLICSFTDSNGNKKILKGIDSGFIRTLGAGFVRESCFSCKYATTSRVGDITIGDFWGTESKNREIQKQGTSMILCNNEKGENFLNKQCINNKIWMEDKTIDTAISSQPIALKRGKFKPKNYDEFFLNLKFMERSQLYKKYIEPKSFKEKVISLLPPLIVVKIYDLLKVFKKNGK